MQTHHLPVLLLLAMSSSGQSSVIASREHDGTAAAAAEGLEFEGVAGKALLGDEPGAAGAPPNTGALG